MGLFKRVNDIISANLNELIDGFEDPEKMLRQAIREMEGALSAVLDGAARVMANEKRLAKQLGNWQTQAESWKQRAEMAVRDNDDDAARHAIVRRQECEKMKCALQDQHTATEETARKLRRQIEAMRVRLAEAQRKAATLSARNRVVEARKTFVADLSSVGAAQSAFGKFDRVCESIELAEAEADARLELSGDQWPSGSSAEHALEIDAELIEIKKSLQASH